MAPKVQDQLKRAAAQALGTGMIELSVAVGAGLTYASGEHGAVAATVGHGPFAFWRPWSRMG
ncbi:hypothetical protein [Jiangella mangrovi]|uniref:Uncharacterized protein n=1 Tax=Jiangella mangrovi TaxID=1524084 RepID=A0A7W9GRP9_9ACTN|nr:hypothetical protein [Jiangella mangrovi]MBB5788677.1 hypothetical protein [Jiangella mangrovi]